MRDGESGQHRGALAVYAEVRPCWDLRGERLLRGRYQYLGPRPDAGCFTGFLAETRTSTPFDARLKDFVLGEFDLCEIEVSKTGDEISKVGDDVDYTITIENTGALTVWKDDISDTVFGDLVVNGVNQADPNAWTDFNFGTADPCGASLLPGADCTIEVTQRCRWAMTIPCRIP